MPVVQIRALPQDRVDTVKAAGEVGAAIAKAAAVPADEIWVVWAEIPAGRYVIAGDAPAAQPRGTHPPLVEISATSGRTSAVAEAMMQAAARAVGDALGIPPSNVRVLYAEVPPGRLLSRGRFQ